MEILVRNEQLNSNTSHRMEILDRNKQLEMIAGASSKALLV